MLTFLITVPPGLSPRGANQMRQHLDIKEHFRRGNAQESEIVTDVFLRAYGGAVDR
jgi:hypothetical protein